MFQLITSVMTWLEQHLILALLIVFAGINTLVLIVLAAYVKFYGRLPNGRVRDRLHKMVYEIDRAADGLENPVTRAKLVSDFQQILGWKRFFVPAVLLNWILAAEVACVRKMQVATGVPDLHREVTTNASGDTGGYPDNG